MLQYECTVHHEINCYSSYVRILPKIEYKDKILTKNLAT